MVYYCFTHIASVWCIISVMIGAVFLPHGEALRLKQIHHIQRVISMASRSQEDVGVSTHGATPKWMVIIRENPIKMDDLGVPPF